MRKFIGVIIVALSALAWAQPDASAFITLKDGSIVSGHLVSIDDHQITGVVEPDGDTRTYKREDLTPGSWYMVRSRTAGDDAKARMVLARFCVENNLFGNAEEELKKVWDLDESMRDAAKELYLKAHEAGAKNLLTLAEAAMKNKKYRNAKRLASRVATEYDQTESAKKAVELLDRLAANEEATPSMQKQVHQPLTEADVDKMREDDPRAVEARKYLDRARERNLKGLKEGSMSAAEGRFKGSVSDFEHVLKIADKVLKEEKDEPVLVKRVNEFKKTTEGEMVEVYVNWAGLMASRSSYPNARKIISQCLSKFPDNQRAKSYMTHIDTMAAMASGDRWGRRGR